MGLFLSARRVGIVWTALVACLTLALLGLVAASSALASVVAGSSEAPGVREALRRQLQTPGPSLVSKGGSGGSSGAGVPAGNLVPSLSTAYSNTWSVPREPSVTRIYNTPVNYRGSDGQWHAIDNTLLASALGGYENAANDVSLRLPESLTSAVSVAYQGQTVSFTLNGAAASLPSVSGESASYAGVLASTDLEYVSESTGVREIATLRDAGAPSQLQYTLTLPAGLLPRQQPDGSITLIDGQGNTWFTIPAPVAYRPSAGPDGGRALPMTIAESGSGWLLTVDTSESWLREELAGGSLAVDPTVTVSATQACTLNAESPKTGACASSTLQVGYDATHQERHGLLKFSLASLPQAALVLNAKLGLYVEAKSTANAKAVGVYRVMKPWTTGATWETYDGTHAWSTAGGDYSNPEKNSDASVNSSVGVSTGWYYWYPTKMVQEWANTANAPENEGFANEGLIVKDQSDNITTNLLTIASPTAASNKPYIEVAYEPRGSGSEPQYTQLATPLTDKLTMSVNAASGNLMLTNQDLHIAGIAGNDFSSTRTFNDLNPEYGDIGRWSESMFLEAHEYANGDVHLGNGTGAVFLFAKQSDGSYITPPGIKATLCASGYTKSPCPASLPSGVERRLLFEDPGGHYVDYNSIAHWAYHIGDRYGNTLTAGYTEGTDAITSWTDTRGRSIKYKVAPSSSYTEISDVSGARHTSYGYNEEASPQLTSYTDASGKITKYEYASSNLTKVTTPKGNVIKLVYDASHRITEVLRTTNTEHTTGPTTKFKYYEVGEAPTPCESKQKATLVKDPDWSATGAHETLYCSNVLDEVEKTIDASKNETAATFNPFGEQTSTTAAAPGGSESGGVANLNYDSAGINLECTVRGTSTPQTTCPTRPAKAALVTSFSYKDQSNLFSATQVENPQNTSQFACYNKGKPEGSEGPACPTSTESAPAGTLQNVNDQLSEQHELSFEYETNGTIKASSDADKHTTKYEYDEKGNLKKITPPSPLKATTITVDADSRPHVITDGAGHIATITYDTLDRVLKIAYTGTGTAKTVSFEYDADGNASKREDSTGTTKYTVDPLNRLTKEELPGSITHSYEYDNASNMTAFIDGGGTTKYKYNGLNELESMTEPGASTSTSFEYNNDHALDKITYPSGAKEVYKLEATTGRPETITAEGVTGSTVPKLTYTYKSGETNTSLIQTVAESTSNTATYSYDALDRLTQAVSTGVGPNPFFYRYKLDGAGNRTEQAVNLTKAEETGAEKTYYALNEANELECRQSVAPPCSGSSSTELSHYSYDEAGEQTAITPKLDTSGSTFAYNAGSELSTLTPSGESALSLTYGGTGQDDLVTRGATTTIENSLLGQTREIVSGNANCFARTPNGLLIDIRTPSGNYNPLYDAQGDIIGLVNTSGKVERTFRYGPHGENVKSEGTQTIPYPFGYKSGYRMPGGNIGKGNVASGLYHYGQRYYDPTTGRWTQQDPVDRPSSVTQGDRFLFAGSDPINLSDPNGTELLGEIGGYVGGFFGGVAGTVGGFVACGPVCGFYGGLAGAAGGTYLGHFVGEGDEF